MNKKASKEIWILGSLMILLLVVSFILGANQRKNAFELIPRRTTYSTKPGGLKGVYETLEKLGYPVARSLTPLTTQPPDGVLFITSPEISLSKTEWQAVRQWVERGNLLVLSSGLDLSYPNLGEPLATSSSSPTGPSFISKGVKAFRVPAGSSIDEEEWKFEHGGCFEKPFG